jgi:hypothetical protein
MATTCRYSLSFLKAASYDIRHLLEINFSAVIQTEFIFNETMNL